MKYYISNESEKKLRNQQNNAIRIVHNKAKFEHTELFKSTNVLNLYKLNILSITAFMHQVHTKASPPVFMESFQRISHLHSVRSSTLNFSKPTLKLTKAKYRISMRGPGIWNDFVEDCLKKNHFFKMKFKLLNFDNEINVLSKWPLSDRVLIKIVVTIKGLMIKPNGILRTLPLLFH